MNELSIEEKAKRYDEAKARMSKAYNENRCSIGFITEIFSELKESEDEKQGEQNHAVKEVLIKAGLKPYKDGDQWCILLGDNIQEGICGFGDTIDDALYAFLKDLIESQGEQKPVVIIPKFRVGDEIKTSNEESLTITKIDEKGYWSEDLFICRFDDADKWELVEQNPAGWSKEDETAKNNISHILRQYDKISKRENQPCWYIGDCLLWMQNIKDRVQPQTKQEWSEEDEQLYNDLSDTYFYNDEDYPEETYKLMLKRVLDWMTKRAKSLRPQNHWKPSEEQMKVLEFFIPYVTECNIVLQKSKDTLLLLLSDLKKLKG